MAKIKTEIKISIRIPRIIFDLRNADPKLLAKIEGALETLDASIKVIGEGLQDIPHVFSLEQALEEADIWVYLSDKLPKDFSLVVKNHIVPVMSEAANPKARNYDPVNESGNSFLFPKSEAWHIYGSVVRAIENFSFSHDWQNLVGSGRKLI